MFDEKLLWKQRLGQTTKELGKYLRYIFNGHIVIVLVFLIGTAAYYYQEWVKTLPSDFPVSIIMAIVLSFLLTYSPIYTFLMEADRIFLLPVESQLAPYFKRSIFVSFFVQIYVLLLGLAVFMPMYAQVNNGDFSSFFPFLFILCLGKIANLLIRWKVQFFVETNVHLVDSLIRYCVNFVLLYFLFSSANSLFLIPVIVLYIGLYFYYRAQTKLKGLKWEFLIDQEERRMMSFYRIANLFTDVPKLRDQVKRRKWLDWVAGFLSYGHDKAYSYLYVHTFIRGGDYLGLFARLSIIGMLGLYYVTFGYGQILFVVLFLYLTGFQLLPLWNHHQNKIWLELYPVSASIRGKSFQNLLFRILLVQSLLFSIPLFLKGEWMTAILSIAAGTIFGYLFVYIYSKKKLRL